MLRLTMGLVVVAITILSAALLPACYFFPLTSQKVDLETGRQVFNDRCASCHSVAENSSVSYGPTLQNVGMWAGSRVEGQEAEEYIYQSIVDPSAFRPPGAEGEMPIHVSKSLSDTELLSLTAYLCSQGGEVRYRRLLKVMNSVARAKSDNRESASLQLGSIERGRELFQNKLNCSSCHFLDDSPGTHLLAPNLLRAGLHTRDYLRKAILDPDAHVAPTYVNWNVIDQLGRVYSGRVLRNSDDGVDLLVREAGGGFNYMQLSKDEIEPWSEDSLLNRIDSSPMPSLREQLSEADINSLLDFLSTLR